jgi:hypothetical protein
MDDTKLGRTKTPVRRPRDESMMTRKVLFVRQPLSSEGHHRTTMLPFPAACQYLQLQY